MTLRSFGWSKEFTAIVALSIAHVFLSGGGRLHLTLACATAAAVLVACSRMLKSEQDSENDIFCAESTGKIHINHDSDEALEALKKAWYDHISDLRMVNKVVDVHTRRIDWHVDGTEDYLQEANAYVDADFRRFLIARQGNMAKALDLARCAAKWRAAVQPARLLPWQVETGIRQGVFKFGGWTKCGYPIKLVEGGRWFPSQFPTVDDCIRYIAYYNETILRALGPGVDKWVVIIDVRGFSPEMIRPMGLSSIQQICKMNSEVDAERLAAVFLLHPPRLFELSWHLFRQFMDEKTDRKIRWVGSQDIRRELGKFIDLSQLEQEFGGDMPTRMPFPTGVWDVDTVLPQPPPYNPLEPDPLRDP